MHPSATFPFDKIGDLSVGGGPFGNLFSSITEEEARKTIDAAYGGGIRLFDTAPFYGFGLSERRVGDALRERGDAYFLSTKVGRLLAPLPKGGERRPSVFRSPMPFEAIFDYSYDGVMRSVEDSLQRLGLNAIDILLFHDLAEDAHDVVQLAYHQKIAFESGWRAAEELKRAGVVRALGFGLNSIEACHAAVENCSPDCVLLASRYTLLEQTKALPLLDACLRRGVAVLAGAPFNSGILVQGSQAAATYDHVAAPREILESVRVLEDICARHDVPLPAAALQFPLRHPAVRTVVAGFRSQEEVQSAIAWRDRSIPDAFWREIMAPGGPAA